MFDLETEIAKWKQSLAAQNVTSAESLDELESHLRDDVCKELAAGLPPEKALELASVRLGQANALKREFEKIGEVSSASARLHRFLAIERGTVLPVKAFLVPLVFYYLFTLDWADLMTGGEFMGEVVRCFLVGYVLLNLAVAGLLLAARRIRLERLERAVFATAVADALCLTLLCLPMGRGESLVLGAFLALLLRNTLSFPRLASQVLLNASAILCYSAAVVFIRSYVQYLSPKEAQALELGPATTTTELALLHISVLILFAVCCSGASFVLSRQSGRLKVT